MTAFRREYGVCTEQRAEHSWVCFVSQCMREGCWKLGKLITFKAGTVWSLNFCSLCPFCSFVHFCYSWIGGNITALLFYSLISLEMKCFCCALRVAAMRVLSPQPDTTLLSIFPLFSFVFFPSFSTALISDRSWSGMVITSDRTALPKPVHHAHALQLSAVGRVSPSYKIWLAAATHGESFLLKSEGCHSYK